MLLKKSLENIASSNERLQKVAYVNNGKSTSYQELFSSAEEVRKFLVQKNNNKPVIVFGHKQAGMFSTFLGCNASGVAFVPVDVTTPKERVENVIRLSGADFIVALSPLPFDVSCNIVEFDLLVSGEHYKLNLDSYVKNEDISYIIFTSGSTGVPKGVEISIEALDDFVFWSKGLVQKAKEHVFVNQALFSFDLSVFELWTSIALEGKILGLEHKNNSNIRAHFEEIQKEKCTVWVSTPSFADLCLIDKRFSAASIPSLEYFVFCGEVLAKSTALKLKERFPDAHILNLYGPTEATCAMTAIEITQDVLNKYEVLPVGYVKEGTELYVDTANGNNELVIVGNNVSHGYINDPVKTAAQFFKKDGLRAYRTGDYGYFEEGNLLFVKGRIDRQIKFKGYRIELEEIEAVIRKTLDVSHAACIAVVKNEKVTDLIGVLSGDVESSYSEFAEKLKPYLPDYMIPTKVRYVQVMPLNSNGKIDRKKLDALVNSKE
nr:AMP-binding protein [Bacteriovorax sp. HI3]